MCMIAIPQGNRLETATNFAADLGGAGGNISVALCRLGTTASLLTPIADDAVGHFTQHQLLGHDVDINPCRMVGKGTKNNLHIIGGPPCTYVNYFSDDHTIHINEADVRAIPYNDIGGLIIDGSKLNQLNSQNAIIMAMQHAQLYGVPTIVDLVAPLEESKNIDDIRFANRKAISMANIVFGNDQVYDFVAKPFQSALVYAQNLPKSKSTYFSVYKMGKLGSQTFTRRGIIRTEAYKTEPKLSFGAGHALLAGVMAGLSDDFSLPQALKWGAATAKLFIDTSGIASSMPTRLDVTSFFSQNND